MKGLRQIVPLAKESMRGVTPRDPGAPPRVEWVRPTDLFVEENYQRDMASSSSTGLVRKVAGAFRWSHFKPPVCVWIDEFEAYVVIDGQHTATAAASNPHIALIPVLVVDAAELAERAEAFVGHNRTRLGLTQLAIYKAQLAHGDETAAAVDRACRHAGAKIALGVAETRADRAVPGITMAVRTMLALVASQGEAALVRALKILVTAGRAPIKAGELAAVALAIEGTDGTLDDRLAAVVKTRSEERWSADAASMAADSGIAPQVAVATIWRQEIGLSRPVRQLRNTGPGGARLLKVRRGNTTPIKVPPAAAPASERSAPPTLPAPPPVPEKPEPKPSPVSHARVVSNGGVTIDLDTGTIARGPRTIRLPLDQAAFAGALLRQTPALLPADRVASKVWGSPVPSPKARLNLLLSDANLGLAAVRMKIREYQGSFAISDL